MFLAHAFGERYDLPIPLVLFVIGGALVVLASFALVLRRAVTTPDTADAPDEVAPTDRVGVGGAVAVVVLLALCAAGLLGSQEVAENILPTAFWLIVWIAVPISVGLVGDWTRPANPFRALSALGDRPALRRTLLGRAQAADWPAGLGWWPAVALFFLLAAAELVFNLTATRPAVIATGLLVYGLCCLVCGAVFGPAWTSRGEAFSVLFETWGRLGWFRFGRPGRRGFGGGLGAGFAPVLSRVVFVLLLLISVNFDGLLATPRWADLERRALGADAAGLDAFRLAAFVLLALVLLAAFGAFAVAAASAGRHGTGVVGSLAGLLPSMLPIAFAYLLAHNAKYLLVNAQLLLPLIGNPVGSPSWPIHLPHPFNDEFDPNPTLLPSAFYWYLGVVAIVAAHVVAVVLAHAHLARAGADERAARRSEYPWLLAMVGYTMVSLVLIAQPLVQEGAG